MKTDRISAFWPFSADADLPPCDKGAWGGGLGKGCPLQHKKVSYLQCILSNSTMHTP